MERVHPDLWKRIFVIAVVLLSLVLAGCGLSVVGPLVGGEAEATAVPVALSSQPALQPAATPTQPPTPTSVPSAAAQAVPLAGTTPASAPMLDATTVVGALEELMIGVYKQVNSSVVHIRVTVGWGRFAQEATGSGFVLDREGHIVTNNHVVEGATDITVTFANDTEVPARVIGTDPGSDLAVIAVDLPADRLHPAELGDSDQVVPGQLAMAIGNPFGLEGSITMGIVSAVGRVIQPQRSRFSIAHMIQTDAPINPGNSGGPLLDSRGRVIGVNTLIFSQTGTSAGVGFAVPVNAVKRVVPELIARGRYDHPWLGVSGYSITPRLARELDLPAERGVLIGDVDANGPAARAGLRGGSRQVVVDGTPFIVGGDMVIAIDGRPVKSMDDIIAYLEEERQVGDVVRLTVLRAGQEREITVRLAARP